MFSLIVSLVHLHPHTFFLICFREQNIRRRFEISQSLGGCDNTLGWLSISDGPSTPCNWNATYEDYPVFSYGKMNRKTKFGTGSKFLNV